MTREAATPGGRTRLLAACGFALAGLAAPATAADCAVSALPPIAAPAGSTDPDGFFPTDYQASRDRFRRDCAAALALHAGACRRFKVDDPADPDLTIDTAYLGAGTARLVVLQSGLHGAEGFAGAAIQAMVFQRGLQAFLDAGFDVLMIHAANPYGFKHVRRVDGCNIDLNRNFPAEPDLYRTVNAPYRELRGLVERGGPVGDVDAASLRLGLETTTAAALHGSDFVTEATHRGQYEAPAGFEFGGSAPEQQTAILRGILAPLVAAHPRDVYFLDLHTGLGPPQTLTVFAGAGWPCARAAAVDRATADVRDAWAEDPRRAAAGGAGSGVRFQTPTSSAFKTSGDVIDFVPGLADDDRVTALTLEWGTVGEDLEGGLTTNVRMTLEHQAAFHGCWRAEECAQAKKNFANLFNPPDAAFQAAVLGQADVFLTRLRGWAPGSFAVGPRPDPTQPDCPAPFAAR